MNKEQIKPIIKEYQTIKDYNFNSWSGFGAPEIRITPKGFFLVGSTVREFLDIASKNMGYSCSFLIGVKDGKPELIIF